MVYGIDLVSIEIFATIVTMSTRRVVLTIHTYAAAPTSRQQVELLVEAAFVRVRVAVACFFY